MANADLRTTNGNTPSPTINLSSTLCTSHTKGLISYGAGDLTAFCLYVITFWILFGSQKILKQTTAFLCCWNPRLVLTFTAARKEWVARQRQRLSGFRPLTKENLYENSFLFHFTERCAPAGFPCCLPPVGQRRMTAWWWVMNQNEVTVADFRHYENICFF